ncbi:alpha/beta-hydrolase [Mycena sanguinolenta]|nr:alpha/beta-hydrolase [Mycena sanguinolenta]
MRFQLLALLPIVLQAYAVPSLQYARDDPIWDAILALDLVGNPPNDYSCKSTVHPNPVFLIHALSANPGIDLNLLQDDMKAKGYCTYSYTYGAHTLAPWIGGMTAMRDSVEDLSNAILDVLEKTGADKIDLVGHSEGGVMTLYAPLRNSELASKVERLVALGPAVHGAQYFGLTRLFYIDGIVSRTIAQGMLDLLGCEACDDMATGGAVYEDFLAASNSYNGVQGSGIIQAGTKPTIIMSTHDTLVDVSVSMVNETGVRNVLVQDSCPDDPVGHAGLAWDTSVWSLVYNALEENYDGPVECGQGIPA